MEIIHFGGKIMDECFFVCTLRFDLNFFKVRYFQLNNKYAK